LQNETAQIESEGVTQRIEAESESQYVKETRPKIARWSAIATFIYVGVVVVLNALSEKELVKLDAYLILTMYAPALGYMGMRTLGTVAEAIKAMALMRAGVR
jgi:hypothetical protein